METSKDLVKSCLEAIKRRPPLHYRSLQGAGDRERDPLSGRLRKGEEEDEGRLTFSQVTPLWAGYGVARRMRGGRDIIPAKRKSVQKLWAL